MVNFFESHPFFKGMGTIIAVDTLFGILGFRELYQLAVITFFTTIIVLVAYFDDRIKN